MAALRPRVREQKMKNRDGICRNQMLDRVSNFESRDPRVRQTFSLDFSTGTADASKQALDADEIGLGIFPSYCGEKRTVAATEINFDGGVATKNRPEIEPLETITGDEFDLTCYGLGGIGGHVR